MACVIDKDRLASYDLTNLIRLAKFLGVSEETVERCERPGVQEKHKNNLIDSVLYLSGKWFVAVGSGGSSFGLSAYNLTVVCDPWVASYPAGQRRFILATRRTTKR